jgi:galactose-1-phosphate uridylyltransferase
MIVPFKRQIKNLLELTENEKSDLAEILRRGTKRME